MKFKVSDLRNLIKGLPSDHWVDFPNPDLDKAVAALKEIAKDQYEANPWTVVPTAAAKKSEDVLKELGEL